MTIRVIAVDDHHLILKALSDLLKGHPDIQLVATSNQGSQLLKLIRDNKPDVAIVDLGMTADSFDPISIKPYELYPNVKVLILTGTMTDFGCVNWLKPEPAGTCSSPMISH
jgi:two-component system response regulator DegU